MSDGPDKPDVPPGRRTAEDGVEDDTQQVGDEEQAENEDDQAVSTGLDAPDAQEEGTHSDVPSADELFDAVEREQPVGTQDQQELPADEPAQERKPVSQMNFDERVTAADEAIRKSKRGLDPEEILEYTTDRRSLAPHVQIEWGISSTVTVIIMTLVLTFILGNFGVDPRVGTLILIVLFVVGMVWIVLRYKKWVYQVRADALYLERGVLTHRRSLVPYVRIQHVDTRRGVLERWLGLSTLVVYTAGSRGADVTIPGLNPDEARDLQQRVKELAIEAEGGDAL